jgi:hypothetical protein
MNYERYADPEGTLKEKIQRYRSRLCGLTISVLPPHRLPYRSIRSEWLQEDFDQRAGIQAQGLDPPPRIVEVGLPPASLEYVDQARDHAQRCLRTIGEFHGFRWRRVLGQPASVV